jgi:hypothetical protein
MHDVVERLCFSDWDTAYHTLDNTGIAVLPKILDVEQCNAFMAMFEKPTLFRSRIDMQRYNFGKGVYQYFSYPLPRVIQSLRETLYQQLAPTARQWAMKMRIQTHFPVTHAEYILQCKAAGQLRPTPLILRYHAGDYNCLHQDLYGEQVFPLQAICMLSNPQTDFTGGELVLTEQRPRMQSRAHVLHLQQGDMAILAVHSRPQKGSRDFYRTVMRHGVSTIHSGTRHTIGIILHDAV